MPRKPRIEFPGAVYHVISRGNRREAIVRDDHDRRRFLETTGEACTRMGWRVHAWVLMPNHYHWLLETPEANLVQGMQWFQSTWSIRFRLRHCLNGHVLQGRYKAIPIEPESGEYFQVVSSYIHLNPVRTRGLLAPNQALEKYPWSSYPSYLKPANKRPDWLEVRRVLGNLGLNDTAHNRRAYREHMREYVAEVRGQRGAESQKEVETEWKHLRRGWCFGDESFREKMLDRVEDLLEGRRGDAYSGEVIREVGERRAEELLSIGLEELGLSGQDLRELKKTDVRKQVLAWMVRRHTSVRNQWVSEHLWMGHEVNVSQSLRRVEEEVNPELKRLKVQIKKTLISKV